MFQRVLVGCTCVCRDGLSLLNFRILHIIFLEACSIDVPIAKPTCANLVKLVVLEMPSSNDARQHVVMACSITPCLYLESSARKQTASEYLSKYLKGLLISV